jgi:hypothetical protein
VRNSDCPYESGDRTSIFSCFKRHAPLSPDLSESDRPTKALGISQSTLSGWTSAGYVRPGRNGQGYAADRQGPRP